MQKSGERWSVVSEIEVGCYGIQNRTDYLFVNHGLPYYGCQRPYKVHVKWLANCTPEIVIGVVEGNRMSLQSPLLLLVSTITAQVIIR